MLRFNSDIPSMLYFLSTSVVLSPERELSICYALSGSETGPINILSSKLSSATLSSSTPIFSSVSKENIPYRYILYYIHVYNKTEQTSIDSEYHYSYNSEVSDKGNTVENAKL